MTQVLFAWDFSRFTEDDSKFVRSLPPRGVGLKVGLIAMTAFHMRGSVAETAIHRVRDLGGTTCFDGKFGDIPNQVAGATWNVTKMGITMLTVRANAEERMLRQAVIARDEAHAEYLQHHPGASRHKPLIFGVAVHSSEAQNIDATLRYTERAAECGFEGIVAPGKMLVPIRACFPELKTLNVGIRPAWADWINGDDQQQQITHLDSAAAGADYMVIGRAISHAKNANAALDKILYELKYPE